MIHFEEKNKKDFKNKSTVKNFPSKGGGGSQNLGTVPKLYLVINYEGFPKPWIWIWVSIKAF